MKLSKIINQFNKDGLLSSITIDVRQRYVVCIIFRRGCKNDLLKVYRNLNIDIEVPEANLNNVAHLGIKRYRHLVAKNYYINLYNY